MKIRIHDLAQTLGLTYQGDGDCEISGVNTLDEAGPLDLSFLANPKYRDQLSTTAAGAVVVDKDNASLAETALISATPYLDFARAVQLFAKPQGSFTGQSPLASIHPEAEVHEDATVYPFVYVGARAKVGAGVTLFSGVYIGEDSVIGPSCTLYPNCTIMAGTELGEKVVLHPGAVVGSDGFGFAQAGGGFEKFPQIGRTVIEDRVEIGANTTIDRAALGETRVCRGTKIDNLVQLGHNVTIGENGILVAQVGIAGSTKVGKNAVLAGQVGVAGHLEIGDNCRIGAKSGLNRSLPAGTDASGIPAMEHRKFLKVAALLGKLPQIVRRLTNLERTVAGMKKGEDGNE
ncbi:MAG: UDP-3-O-(3-hydroxymyristoyl)glucosamine N-acyltransferase [Desulfovibrionales bacterium]